MPNFKKYSSNQDAMVVINFEQQIHPNTFEYIHHHLIENHIDLSAFYDKYDNDRGARTAYDPAILLKLILFAYSKGITSSREIQWQRENNVIFKALSCDMVPHFTCIAGFVSKYPDAIESVFEQILLVCDQQELLGNELFAIDGCKMSSNQDRLQGQEEVIPASEFTFNLRRKTCHCPMGNEMWLRHEYKQGPGRIQLYFEGKLTDCRRCPIKHDCMRNPGSADTREGHGRQVSKTFSVHANATDWMKRRVDSKLGKTITGVW